MKIEKLNENQLRATLSGTDLMRRQIHINEFAYGTDAARKLFHELLRFASFKLGFEADDAPLMIEATPVYPDSLVLLVTKTPYPDELDTRFARFSDAPSGDEYLEYTGEDFYPTDMLLGRSAIKATDILDSHEEAAQEDAQGEESSVAAPEDADAKGALSGSKIADSEQATSDTAAETVSESADMRRFTRRFHMKTIDEVLDVSKMLGGSYRGESALYRTARGYELIVRIGEQTPIEFNRVINILSEFGTLSELAAGSEYFLKEHARCLIKKKALQKLAKI